MRVPVSRRDLHIERLTASHGALVELRWDTVENLVCKALPGNGAPV